LTCKNRLPYNLYCVGGDVKHCTIQSKLTDGSLINTLLNQTTDSVFDWVEQPQIWQIVCAKYYEPRLVYVLNKKPSCC